ncbi:adenylyl-sulfate reductase subunit beta [uncultured Thiodictyon sp.]|uniref:adenylyl-sulfate reductase subunit beta n=1 Tax=uncultured Thiodictyon sp. TaxID=1846217 RepID=UPI0025F7946B|nr:adenylyl-sulfate reductase subunit beta [uncultured Thiodictyon sp.]
MPSFVRIEKCDACKGLERIACEYICPHDLMKLDRDGGDTGHAMKAYNQEPEQCWECYACVKDCPKQAIEVRHYADVVPLGASVQPLRTSDAIMWTIKFRNGTMKRFKFPIRTTVAGALDPYAGKPGAELANIGKPGFFTTGVAGLRAAASDQLIRT